MLLEHLLLLSLQGTMGLVRPCLPDGVPGERWQRELGVVPQVEPPFVPAAIRASQGGRDVAVAPALLHPEVGAAYRRRPSSTRT
jgi:hypothetical protein